MGQDKSNKPKTTAAEDDGGEDFLNSLAKLVELAEKDIADKAPLKRDEPPIIAISADKPRRLVVPEFELSPPSWLEKRFGTGFKIKLSPAAVVGIGALMLCMGSYSGYQLYQIFTKERVVAEGDEYGVLGVLSDTATGELKAVSINELAKKNQELRDRRAAEKAAEEAAEKEAAEGVAKQAPLEDGEGPIQDISREPGDVPRGSSPTVYAKFLKSRDLTNTLPGWIWKSVNLQPLTEPGVEWRCDKPESEE